MIESFGASGNISGEDLPRLLLYLHDIQFEGQALFTLNTNTKSIYINRGLISYGVSDDYNEALDNILVKHSIIPKEILDKSIDDSKSLRMSLAKYLLQEEHVSSTDLIKASELQVIDIAASILTTQLSIPYFLKKDTFSSDILNLKITPSQIVFDALHCIQDESWINKLLISKNTVFTKSEDFVDRYKHISFQEETDVLIAKIDGKRRIVDILENHPQDHLKIKQTLSAMLLLGLIESVEEIDGGADSPILQVDDKSTQRFTPAEMEIMSEVKKIPEPKENESFASTDELEDVLSDPSFDPPPVPVGAGEDQPVVSKTSSPEPVNDDLPLPPNLLDAPPPFPGNAAGESKSPISAPIPVKAQATPPPPVSRPSFQEPVYQKANLISTEVRERAKAGGKIADGTTQYMQMLQKQRKRSERIRGATLILILIFGALAAVYFLVIQKGASIPFLSSNDTNTHHNEISSVPTNNSTPSTPANTTSKLPISVTKPQNRVTPPRIKPDASGSRLIAKIKPLMTRGRFQEAAKEWKKDRIQKSGYTISVEVACSPTSVQKIYNFDKELNNLFLLPRKIQGRNCFRICWGLFPNKREAQRGISTLPSYYRKQQPSPKAISIKKAI